MKCRTTNAWGGGGGSAGQSSTQVPNIEPQNARNNTSERSTVQTNTTIRLTSEPQPALPNIFQNVTAERTQANHQRLTNDNLRPCAPKHCCSRRQQTTRQGSGAVFRHVPAKAQQPHFFSRTAFQQLLYLPPTPLHYHYCPVAADTLGTGCSLTCPTNGIDINRKKIK